MGLYGETSSPFGKETLVDKEEILQKKCCAHIFIFWSLIWNNSMR